MGDVQTLPVIESRPFLRGLFPYAVTAPGSQIFPAGASLPVAPLAMYAKRHWLDEQQWCHDTLGRSACTYAQRLMADGLHLAITIGPDRLWANAYEEFYFRFEADVLAFTLLTDASAVKKT